MLPVQKRVRPRRRSSVKTPRPPPAPREAHRSSNGCAKYAAGGSAYVYGIAPGATINSGGEENAPPGRRGLLVSSPAATHSRGFHLVLEETNVAEHNPDLD